MNNKRQVNWSILYNLLKGKRPFAIIGLVFTCLAIFALFPLIFIISASVKEPYEKYDLEEIRNNGVEKSAKITSIRSVNNVTINGDHPEIISYDYENNGISCTDKFETLDLEKTTDYTIGKEIKILVYQNQTMIKGLEPFSFPVYFFYILPIMFLIIGSILLLIGLIPALKTLNLYKTGVVKEAHIVSIISNAGSFPMRGLRQTFSVNYYFFNELGNKVFGESATGDILFLNDKKAGDTIKIFVSETDERRSCLIPTLEAMKYNWNV